MFFCCKLLLSADTFTNTFCDTQILMKSEKCLSKELNLRIISDCVCRENGNLERRISILD